VDGRWTIVVLVEDLAPPSSLASRLSCQVLKSCAFAIVCTEKTSGGRLRRPPFSRIAGAVKMQDSLHSTFSTSRPGQAVKKDAEGQGCVAATAIGEGYTMHIICVTGNVREVLKLGSSAFRNGQPRKLKSHDRGASSLQHLYIWL
jgi:hypothetical protein